jgi:hypothetical protein
MDPLRLFALAAQVGIVFALMWIVTRIWLRRQRGGTAGLRGEVEAQAHFATTLDGASIRGKGFGGSGWLPMQGPQRLIVGADAFIFSAPNSLKQYVFRGNECSIAFSQAPSRFANRDWIVITGQSGGRNIQLAVTHRDSLQKIWQALAGTGAAQVTG